MKNVVNTSIITEARLRQIIREELERKYLIEEGLWDDVKDGVKKLSDYVSDKFKSAAASWAETINEKIQALSQKPKDLDIIMSAIQQGMKETGESVPLDKTLQMAKGLGKDDSLAAIESDLAGPVHDAAEQLQKSGKALGEVYSILMTNNYINRQKIINEMGPATLIGFGLAIVGGLPMLLKGLHKLASYLKAERAAALFEKGEHIAHKLEETVVEYAINDRLSYAIYKFLNGRGYHVSDSKELLTFEQYKSNEESNARKKTEGLIYKALLIYFAINGLVGILKAGASLLGFVEGGATAIKGVELAAGAEEVAAIVRAAEIGAAAGIAAAAV